MALNDLPADLRPREKLLSRGAAALGDAELLALLLRTGVAGTNVLQLAQQLLDTFGGLAGLLQAGVDDLKRVKGLGGTAKPYGKDLIGSGVQVPMGAQHVPGLEAALASAKR